MHDTQAFLVAPPTPPHATSKQLSHYRIEYIDINLIQLVEHFNKLAYTYVARLPVMVNKASCN